MKCCSKCNEEKQDDEFYWQNGRLTAAYCKCDLRNGFEFDHKIPIARGGVHAIENICIACPRCNRKKGSLTTEEFHVEPAVSALRVE